MPTVKCPVCKKIYLDELYCANCSWDLREDTHWIGDTAVIRRSLQNQLLLARENWEKIKQADGLKDTLILYSKTIHKTYQQLKSLKERHPNLSDEIESIMQTLEG